MNDITNILKSIGTSEAMIKDHYKTVAYLMVELAQAILKNLTKETKD